MRTRQLETFVCICEVGSITKAAAVLNIAQPALSAQITALENELGVRLLIRSPQGVSTTPAGSFFLNEVREIMQRLVHVRKTVKTFADIQETRLVIGLPPSLSTHLTLRLAQELTQANKHVELSFVEQRSEDLAVLVTRGDVDIALAFNIVEHEGLVRQPVITERLFFVAGAGSEFARPGPIDMNELAQASFVMPIEGSQIMNLLKGALAQHGLPLNVAFRIESMQAIKDTVALNAAAAVLPLVAVTRDVEAGTVIARPIVNPPLVRTLYILQPTGRHPSASERTALKIVESCVVQLAGTYSFERVEADRQD